MVAVKSPALCNGLPRSVKLPTTTLVSGDPDATVSVTGVSAPKSPSATVIGLTTVDDAPVERSVRVVTVGKVPSSAYVCVPATLTTPLVGPLTVPGEMVPSPQSIVAMLPLNAPPSFTVGAGWGALACSTATLEKIWNDSVPGWSSASVTVTGS